MGRNSRRYFTLQAGRGIAAIVVVFHHAATYAGIDPRYWRKPSIFHHLIGTALGVEYFFVLSGVVILLAHWSDMGNPSTIPSYIWKRFRRVYPIYWVPFAIVVLEHFIQPAVGASYQRDPWVVLSGILLVHIHSLDVNLPVAWTLFHEVLFYIAFVAVLLRKYLGIAILSLWGLMSLVVWIHPLGPYLTTYLFSPLHLLFGFGMLIAVLLRSEHTFFPVPLTVLGCLIFVYSFFWSGQHGTLPMGIQILAGIGSTFLILGMALLEKHEKLVVSRSLNFLGDASYSIYLVHYPLLMFCVPFIYKGWLHFPVPMWCPVLLMGVLGTAGGCLLHLYVERPILRRLY